MKRTTYLTCLLAAGLLACAVVAAQAEEAPKPYQGLYGLLKTALDDFDKYLSAQPGAAHPGPPPVFSAELLMANANRGVDLIKPQALKGVQLELDRFQELGINGVTVAVSYPLLMPDFPDTGKYAAFYQQVAREVRKRHMKLDVEIGAVFANTPFAAALPPYHYADRTFAQYASSIHSMTETVISQMAPDYVNIGSEPDIGASLTGIREFLDPAKNAAYVQVVLKGLDKGHTKMVAGIGNWSKLAYVGQLVKQPELDCIDIHIYPFYSASLLTTITAAADLAKANGKCVVIDEAWLSKSAGGDGSVASSPNVFKRDVYGFWAPLDQQFLTELARLARIKGVEFISPFWTTYFFAYVDYSPRLDRQSYAAVNGEVLKAELANLLGDKFSPTGEYYRQLIRRNSR